MTIKEMESLIMSEGIMLQTVLHAAFVVEQLVTLGGCCCLSQGGSTQGGDPTRLLDMAASVTKHIPDSEKGKLEAWSRTEDVEPRRFPRVALRFWFKVPYRAAWEMAREAPGLV